MSEPVPAEAFPRSDDEVAPFVRSLGVPGIVDVHVHALPDRLQAAVWRYFDRLDDPAWPIAYREPDGDQRLATLRGLGVVAHTALAYAHRPGMARGLNDHTLDLADHHPQVVPTFTIFPDETAADDVAAALARGGRVGKVHTQVGRFSLDDPRLDEVWPQLESAAIPIVAHVSAVYGVDGGEEFCGPEPLAGLLERFPGLVVVLAHLGIPDTDAFLDVAEAYPQLLLEPSMALTDPPYYRGLDDATVTRVAALHERLVFGSDYPSIPHAYAAQVRGLARLGLTAADLAAVLHDRGAALVQQASSRPS